MIIYKDLLGKLKDAGYNTNRLRKEKLLSEETIMSLRKGNHIRIHTLDTICRLTGCRVEELIEYIPDEEKEEHYQE